MLAAHPQQANASDAVRAAYMKRWVNALKLATRWRARDGRPPQSSSPSRASLTTSRGSSPGALRDLADTKVMTPLNKEDYEILGFDLAIKVGPVPRAMELRAHRCANRRGVFHVCASSGPEIPLRRLRRTVAGSGSSKISLAQNSRRT
ncbi:hypothetical protein LXA43DRAFT_1087685 [Ganoderma leucocontextum]|nr:hypothetical protein LXA43DRAFT_1087685 [Ganoderma leucocontextum]